MAGVTVHFLLVYSFSEQKLIQTREFKRADEATQAYRQAEQVYSGRSDEFEVVLVGADSIDTVMKTHGHYFRQADDSLFTDLLLLARGEREDHWVSAARLLSALEKQRD